MKTHFTKPLFVLTLLASLGLLLAGRVPAQTFTTLHSFTTTDPPYIYTNSDGANPQAGLVLSGNTLYGTASAGGFYDTYPFNYYDHYAAGTVFAVNTDGTGFTNLYNFTDGSDGATPLGGLILSGNAIYGTASSGRGIYRIGAVFAINIDGWGFTTLTNFYTTQYDGNNPADGLVINTSGNTLYGTAEWGGSSGSGTLFSVNTNGIGFMTLHTFTAQDVNTATNYDGANPLAGLVLSGNTLYGTASGGGSNVAYIDGFPIGAGTIFAVNTDGTGFTNLHSFTAPSGPYGTNNDGANPQAGLVLSGNTLYGTASAGGSSGSGTIFKVNTDGTGFKNLHSFNGGSDGAFPVAGLSLSGNTLYGTASGGGIQPYYDYYYPSAVGQVIYQGRGTVFAVNTDGTGFTTLHSFTGGSDGINPVGALVLSGNTLYGTAAGGGSENSGTVFSLSFAPQLTLTSSGVPPSGIILSWPTNVAGFDYTGYTLQSTTNLAAPTVWSTNSAAPVVVNGQFTVTNPITGDQMFYRLSQ